jgi:hypothetical protein
MTEVQEAAFTATKAFVEQLCDLRLDGWLAIGRALIASRGVTTYMSVWSTVEQAIAKCDLGLVAWHVRDDVETVAYLVSHAGAPLARSDRAVFAATHGAAENAALALLVQSSISSADLELLYAPFWAQVPRERFAASDLKATRSRNLAREY